MDFITRQNVREKPKQNMHRFNTLVAYLFSTMTCRYSGVGAVGAVGARAHPTFYVWGQRPLNF